MINNAAKSFDTVGTSLSVLHNYYDSTKLFSDLYVAKFLDAPAKPSFCAPSISLIDRLSVNYD